LIREDPADDLDAKDVVRTSHWQSPAYVFTENGRIGGGGSGDGAKRKAPPTEGDQSARLGEPEVHRFGGGDVSWPPPRGTAPEYVFNLNTYAAMGA
jgi:hypothetical protein